MQARFAIASGREALIRSRVPHLTERLTEPLRDPRRFVTHQRLHTHLKQGRYAAFRHELARAELDGEISEFYALSFQAVLAMAEDSEHAADYLEMAEAVASSPYEQAIIAEDRAAYDLLHDDPSAAAERCLATLDRVHQTEGLWVNLLIALYRLGQVETIDATLRRLTRLDGECTTRIVGRLSTDPDLCDVRARPAFQQLLGQHMPCEANRAGPGGDPGIAAPVSQASA